MEDERRREESLKMGFEIAKHISTLNIATAVVVLAVSRDMGIAPRLVTVTLLAFLASLVLCYIAMVLHQRLMALPEQAGPRFVATRTVTMSALTYLVGLTSFALVSLGLIH